MTNYLMSANILFQYMSPHQITQTTACTDTISQSKILIHVMIIMYMIANLSHHNKLYPVPRKNFDVFFE